MSVFKKMNLKPDQISEIVVLNAPESFESELSLLEGVEIARSIGDVEKIHYGLAFVITQAELDEASEAMAAKTEGDVMLWFAYPKKSSKKYTCEFDRDSGWDKIGAAGFEPVRMVAIDQDWSALRFRRVEYIKSLKRSNKMAISAEGKKRTQKR